MEPLVYLASEAISTTVIKVWYISELSVEVRHLPSSSWKCNPWFAALPVRERGFVAGNQPTGKPVPALVPTGSRRQPRLAARALEDHPCHGE